MYCIVGEKAMNLHEYQSKQLLAKYGLPLLKGVMVNSVEQAISAVSSLSGDSWMVKAQIHAGGRGQVGGVKKVSSKEALSETARRLLHSSLVTHQTTEKGQPVHQLLIEETCEIEREFYLGAVIDRSAQKIAFMASKEGGVEIEKVAETSPEKILKLNVDPLLGIMPFQCREVALQLGLTEAQSKQLIKIMTSLYRLFVDYDLSLIEINPLVVTKQGDLLCLDAKINIDDNALYRQPNLRDMRDNSQEDPREMRAREWELNYIPLEGEIGCMVNGAGLAMATMDLIKLHGGDPANFLDVGGGATEERVKEAFKIILSDNHVKVVFVNIFGGIVRCDLIAQGIMKAVSEVGIKIPVVVRLQGNRAEEAGELLGKSGLNIIAVESFNEAAKMAVQMVGGKR
jgi:succinyl-CoA synthetase beta subunit